MLELENGVGVMGDASYLAPESVGQGSTPLYWRMTFHGTGGVLVCQTTPAECEVWSNSSDTPMIIPASASVDSLEGLTGQSYLDSMLAVRFILIVLLICLIPGEQYASGQEITGAEGPLALTTRDVMVTMRATLSAQAVADGEFGGGVNVQW